MYLGNLTLVMFDDLHLSFLISFCVGRGQIFFVLLFLLLHAQLQVFQLSLQLISLLVLRRGIPTCLFIKRSCVVSAGLMDPKDLDIGVDELGMVVADFSLVNRTFAPSSSVRVNIYRVKRVEALVY